MVGSYKGEAQAGRLRDNIFYMKSFLQWQFIFFLRSQTYTLHLIPGTSSPTSQACTERFVAFWRELKAQALVATCFLTENLLLGPYFSFLPLSFPSADMITRWYGDWWRMEEGKAMPIPGVTTLVDTDWFGPWYPEARRKERSGWCFYFCFRIVHANSPQKLSTIFNFTLHWLFLLCLQTWGSSLVFFFFLSFHLTQVFKQMSLPWCFSPFGIHFLTFMFFAVWPFPRIPFFLKW